MTTAYFEISKTGHAGLENVETKFGVFPPINQFSLYAQSAVGLSGLVVAQGLPEDTWPWGYITLPSFELFRSFCPSASVPVWVRTCLEPRRADDPNEYGYYTGIFEMPSRSDFTIRNGLVYPFTVRITHLVAYTPPE